ncbi:Hypothetical predicted protein [Podarcis lilfordi]|uniref:Uncharacterized protein n=1 Tax=Podarcis lilfordi TaxID=74358 RepID=A0AA35L098_9SAUR|nr:Hypothetical predicted protein [Podarcis lilfordi]
MDGSNFVAWGKEGFCNLDSRDQPALLIAEGRGEGKNIPLLPDSILSLPSRHILLSPRPHNPRSRPPYVAPLPPPLPPPPPPIQLLLQEWGGGVELPLRIAALPRSSRGARFRTHPPVDVGGKDRRIGSEDKEAMSE